MAFRARGGSDYVVSSFQPRAHHLPSEFQGQPWKMTRDRQRPDIYWPWIYTPGLHSSGLSFLLFNRIRIFVAFLWHCEIEIILRVRHSENVRFPFCFCWQLQQWLKCWLLSCSVLWPGPWGWFPSSEVTVCWARRMSNCLPLQLNCVLYRCLGWGSPGSSAQSQIRPLHPARAMS